MKFVLLCSVLCIFHHLFKRFLIGTIKYVTRLWAHSCTDNVNV